METQVKERLTGAVILVALIVLLVPELLTGGPGGVAPSTTAPPSAGEPAVRTYSIDLVQGGVRQQPQAAEADLSAKAISGSSVGASKARIEPAPTAKPATAEPVPQTEPAVVAQGEPAARSDMDKPLPLAEPVKPVDTPPPVKSSQRAKVAEKPVTERAAAQPSAERAGSTSADASGWAIQLGSFASRDNAQRLVKQLKGKGFNAFLLGGGGSSGKLYRVRVGPEASRSAADAVGAKLRSAGFKGGAVVAQP